MTATANTILFSYAIRERVVARIFLNGLPFVKGEKPGPDTGSGGVNECLVPGENVVEILVLRVPEGNHLKPESFVRFAIWTRVEEEGPVKATAPIVQNILFKCSFPEVWDNVPLERQRLPYYHRETFTLESRDFSPVYLKSPVHSFGCEGTEDMRAAVESVHGAIAAGDGEKFVDLMDLRFRELERAYPYAATAKVAARREFFLSEVFSHKYEIAPFDAKALHFEPLVGGRVACVTRADGGYAIDAICRDPVRYFRADPLLCYHEGGWRVFG